MIDFVVTMYHKTIGIVDEINQELCKNDHLQNLVIGVMGRKPLYRQPS